jgi:phosphoribosylanthranilate isomerase
MTRVSFDESSMTWVKICGTTNLEDALTAVEAGADAVGFVFYEKSPRNISVEVAREIVGKLPECVEKVGVFVNEPDSQVARIADRAGLGAVQVYPLNGDDDVLSIDCALKGFIGRLVVAIPSGRITSGDSFTRTFSRELLSRASAVLIDSGGSRQPGGTGIAFDWSNAADNVKAISEIVPVMIAGGLTAENVSEAIGILKPWGVDVVSGVEARPGKKDPEKVRAFVRAVREAERLL